MSKIIGRDANEEISKGISKGISQACAVTRLKIVREICKFEISDFLDFSGEAFGIIQSYIPLDKKALLSYASTTA